MARDLHAGLCPEAGAALIWLPSGQRADDAMAFALADRVDVWGRPRGDGMVVVLPPILTARLHGAASATGALAPTPPMAAVARLARGLLAPDLALSRVQAALAGRALTEMLIAALAPPTEAGRAVAAQREASLLQRLCDHIDRHLAAELDVASLCVALGCSRSALYRAAGAVGGVAALVLQRRLATAHRRLLDPDDRTAIAAVASQTGFTDAAGFSRAFRRHFGISAAGVRRQGATPSRR